MAVEFEFYKIQVENSRHLELQRSTIAGIATAVSGAIVGELLKRSPLDKDDLAYTVTLTVVGFIALLFSQKLHERIKYRNELARLIGHELDPSLEVFKKRAEAAMKKKYPLLFWLRLNWLWGCLFGAISVLGLVLTAKILYW